MTSIDAGKANLPQRILLSSSLNRLRIEVSRLSQVAAHPSLAMLSEISPVFVVQIRIHCDRFHGLNLLKYRHYRV